MKIATGALKDMEFIHNRYQTKVVCVCDETITLETKAAPVLMNNENGLNISPGDLLMFSTGGNLLLIRSGGQPANSRLIKASA